MSEQSNNNNAGAGSPPSSNNNNPQRRNNNNRRRHNNRPRGDAQTGPAQGGGPNQNSGQPRAQGNPNQANRAPNPNQNQPRQGQGPQQGQPRRPQHNHNNKPRPQGQPQQHKEGGGPFNIERIYEKYLNLLDQHIIARRKYHDLFYRADPAQKNKLERNFYNTLNDIREFESKLAPDVKTLFEKRNNGYQYDRTYTSNHEIPVEGDAVPTDLPAAEPHYLQSQIACDYSGDVEESVGTAEDYLKYKNF